MSEWTDELRAEVVAAYLKQKPTEDTTVECLEAVAKEFDKTVNGVRMILTKAEAYIKKTPAKSKTKVKEGGVKVSKAAAIETLTTIMQSEGLDIDEDILSKMTGKAAVYFTSIIKAAIEA